MFDHFGLAVSDLKKSDAFYQAALKPLGLERVRHGEGFSAYGNRLQYGLWLRQGGPVRPPLHIAFRAASRALVDAFHAAALQAGGRDNGAPGMRPQYHPNYYGAFILDPDGHNVEAVCHAPA